MKGNHILSSLSYFSYFFAPVILPLIIYLIAEEKVKCHAKKAVRIQLIPCVIILIAIAIINSITRLSSLSENTIVIVTIGTFAIAFIIISYYLILTIVKGIKVLKEV
ncbi:MULTISPECIES: DUF4870 domain-containing protein [Bacillus]|nr:MULTISPECIES: DUF4870 domain-containing protein [Bacillus]PDY44179.1 DUF4870 domain-containing protein [Bacillus pseudomycoides]PEA80900.1 DUF4870 domain-containing protein [Bacillus pseudomycoides]PED73860.1 DUF4870 domain-containing protein [Bacillus pseudomycoides]PEI34135.1 DUF4870 domain-containing protein [Bacillus pseudomycoides]PEJ75982.1 DUF4870 domain-containing protein [Bacillus pseudomycoides]